MFKNKNQITKNGSTPELKKIRAEILDIFSAAVNAVNPYNCVKYRFKENFILINDKQLDIRCFDNVYLIGFGKASVGMSQAVCDSVNVKEGIVITNDPVRKVDSKAVFTFVGNHPIPIQNNVIGTDKIIELVEKLREKDLLIVLISGGGSALLSKPRIPLGDLQSTTDLLLKCGANIREVNTIRKHLSLVKGGQLIRNVKGKVVSFIISDIIGDPLEDIASGPTHPDSTTFYMAKKILKKYKLLDKVPFSVKKIIEDGIYSKIPDTPKPDYSIFKNVLNIIIANNKTACEAAINKAEDLGYKTMLLSNTIEGEAKQVAKYLIDKATSYVDTSRKLAFISGGETTVTVKGDGLGGRNQEMVLSSVFDLDGKNVVFASLATDGIDGVCDAAGAIADPYTLSRAKKENKDPSLYLKDNNSYEFFKSLNDLLFTGYTGTNVMDIQIIIKIG
jgi:hydroxypyruvate reductase/glycerate 2-kinase